MCCFDCRTVNAQEGVEKKTPLHIAIQYRNLETVNVLLALNVRLDVTDDNLNTVIHQAVLSPDPSPAILEVRAKAFYAKIMT